MARFLLRHPCLTSAGASALISVITALVAPLPAPQFHDEFSYLLAADTFAQGRLTNPTHPHWEFFEAFHELSRPTYASKYPPAQGLVMAAGQVLTRMPIVGVWFSTALACAAIAWMLRAVMSRRWSTMGGLIAATHPLVLDWNWSYWGGSVALLGGALLVGATLRLRRQPAIRASVIAGAGIAILLNSRPLEGAILAALCIGWLMWTRRITTILPMIAVLAPNFAWMGYYNWRVTGDALLPPYALYEKQYAPTRPLTWLPPPTTMPTYRIPAMRDFYLKWELPNYQEKRTLRGFARVASGDVWTLLKSYFRAATLALSLLAFPVAWRKRRWLRPIVPIVMFCVLNALPVLTFFPHYTAPVGGAMLLIAVVCLRTAPRWLMVVVLVGQLAALTIWLNQKAHTSTDAWNFQRQQLIRELSETGQKHLVFVLHPEGSYVHNELVYNAADIDRSPVVWAHDMGNEKNRELISYYPDRKVMQLP